MSLDWLIGVAQGFLLGLPAGALLAFVLPRLGGLEWSVDDPVGDDERL